MSAPNIAAIGEELANTLRILRHQFSEVTINAAVWK